MTPRTRLRILMIGASVRPLIASCLRSGSVPVAFDFFADQDGQQLIQESGYANASLTKIDRYENLLKSDFAKLGDVAILAGGAELQPKLVEMVSEQLPILGPSAESLMTIVDPMQWLQVLKEAGCRVPESLCKLPAAPKVNDWLVKHSGTCGGSGVQVLGDEFENHNVKSSTTDSYFQKRIPGQAWSAVLVSRAQTKYQASETFSLGCTRQWLATDFAEGLKLTRPFAYHGSVGPLPIPKSAQLEINLVANLLAQRFSMRGVWGMDFLLDDDGQVWPVDLNPRITASAELFESAVARSRSKFRSVLDLHLSACCPTGAGDGEEFEKLANDRAVSLGVEDCETKRIVFFAGPDVVEIDAAIYDQLSYYYQPNFFQSNHPGASIADVPKLGERIDAGRPLLTIRSRAKTEAAAMALLDKLFEAVQACVGGIS